jgi:hypothetical protein
MTRATKVKAKRTPGAPPPRSRERFPRWLVALAALGVVGGIAAAALLWRAGGESDQAFQPLAPEDPGPVHVHGLGVNPADGALFIATHTGLYRVGQGQRKAARVGGRYQDTMGFTIVGPNRFLGSGHPDINEAQEQGLPGLLGLIESTDSGVGSRSRCWARPTSMFCARSAGGCTATTSPTTGCWPAATAAEAGTN